DERYSQAGPKAGGESVVSDVDEHSLSGRSGEIEMVILAGGSDRNRVCSSVGGDVGGCVGHGVDRNRDATCRIPVRINPHLVGAVACEREGIDETAPFQATVVPYAALFRSDERYSQAGLKAGGEGVVGDV